MSDEPKPPKRAVTLTLTIRADSDEEIGRALEQFVTQWARGECSGSGCCGGVTYGWTYGVKRDPTMTHERYIAELQEWIEENRKRRIT